MTDSEIQAYIDQEPDGYPTTHELLSVLNEIRLGTSQNWTSTSDHDRAGWLIPSDSPILGRISRALVRAKYTAHLTF